MEWGELCMCVRGGEGGSCMQLYPGIQSHLKHMQDLQATQVNVEWYTMYLRGWSARENVPERLECKGERT